MTRKEAVRQNAQADTLATLGFTYEEAESLRRISMTLRRWHELECGTDSACIVRGRWNQETQAFDYDDGGAPYYEFANSSGRNRYSRTPDRENGAKKRLVAIIGARNARVKPENGQTRIDPIAYYIQTDPRGAALYIIRPGDVPDGSDVNSYYTRGVCVW